ncbi:hypothetical protein LK536_19190 [Lachnoclostridium pacaense]|uniref:hypothetical protein n=1 Tax=Enterocloster hominis (ex Hitch et al. 2024) TaxID=1917870 RepID=UPI001D114F44|nr:hypothetical protein [Lachnoclostridium pacaense]MCC2878405.1 hypothetical protein [Lachnoclostridium pacaense]
MWSMIVCDGDEAEREQLMGLARQCLEEKGVEARVTGCADWPELDGIVKRVLPDAVIVAQDSVEGLNTITSARLLSRKIIWFSDLDFGVQAYRLCVPFFCQKPVSRHKMEQALSRLLEGNPKAGKL